MLIAFLDNFAFQIVEKQQQKMDQLRLQVQVSWCPCDVVHRTLEFSQLFILCHTICSVLGV